MAHKRYFKRELGNDISGYEPFIFDADRVITKDDALSYERYTDIFDAYDRPSSIKAQIYEDWRMWFYHNNGYCWIESRNGFQFTIGGIITAKDGDRYYCHITKSKNECCKIA